MQAILIGHVLIVTGRFRSSITDYPLIHTGWYHCHCLKGQQSPARWLYAIITWISSAHHSGPIRSQIDTRLDIRPFISHNRPRSRVHIALLEHSHPRILGEACLYTWKTNSGGQIQPTMRISTAAKANYCPYFINNSIYLGLSVACYGDSSLLSTLSAIYRRVPWPFRFRFPR